ncbi:MAG: hypothetical protein Edafosvirus37_1 [Edafosvirus sp.]|uniref:Uncharacterized protein n=1 Tax=Edafosvirus sp. TaxID=2487765 RepID=A0A3G4ZVA2_9VIRU|nr:MAG: hypothetical protein Edafosvirus37_1 [Edafosvirus sp.]
MIDLGDYINRKNKWIVNDRNHSKIISGIHLLFHQDDS